MARLKCQCRLLWHQVTIHDRPEIIVCKHSIAGIQNLSGGGPKWACAVRFEFFRQVSEGRRCLCPVWPMEKFEATTFADGAAIEVCRLRHR